MHYNVNFKTFWRHSSFENVSNQTFLCSHSKSTSGCSHAFGEMCCSKTWIPGVFVKIWFLCGPRSKWNIYHISHGWEAPFLIRSHIFASLARDWLNCREAMISLRAQEQRVRAEKSLLICLGNTILVSLPYVTVHSWILTGLTFHYYAL